MGINVIYYVAAHLSIVFPFNAEYMYTIYIYHYESKCYVEPHIGCGADNYKRSTISRKDTPHIMIYLKWRSYHIIKIACHKP